MTRKKGAPHVLIKAMTRNKRAAHVIYTLFLYKNVVFPARAEYSCFSADFRLNIFLYYSCYVFCAEYCTYVLHVPFIELSLALNILL